MRLWVSRNKADYVQIPNCSCQIVSTDKRVIEQVRAKHKGDIKGGASHAIAKQVSLLWNHKPAFFDIHNSNLVIPQPTSYYWQKSSANSENCSQQTWAMRRIVNIVTEKKIVLLLSYYSFNKYKSMSRKCVVLCAEWYY